MQVRNTLAYSSFVLALAVGCSLIHFSTYRPSVSVDPRRSGGLQTARGREPDV